MTAHSRDPSLRSPEGNGHADTASEKQAPASSPHALETPRTGPVGSRKGPAFEAWAGYGEMSGDVGIRSRVVVRNWTPSG